MKKIVAAYRSLKTALEEARDDAYPVGCVVNVDCERYSGPGIVKLPSECPPDGLHVALENGNSYYYPLEKCERVSVKSQWPDWIRREKRRQEKLRKENLKSFKL